ncbi:MAG: glutathione peroxidase [Micavibrio aeruginosavorus]|uniref:Glutathione peroxidase n=1 Tax=Micavibrio aeruginosavorus TaxID=349221 RepID=A0A7T5UJ42_9BACT|nr:MAG: glutathione peroxidase [Micavibrio aeruginosavorus]
MAVVAGFLTLCGLAVPTARAQPAAPQNAYDFSFTTINGEPLPLSRFNNKVLLVVNTASRCGFTPQYEGLQTIYEAYKDKGLVIIGVPANDFGGQEPGSNQEIKRFCAMNYAITFPMTEKTTVTGKGAHPFYQWAAKQKTGGLLSAKPRWNFHKYLVGPDGELAGSFASTTKPGSEDLIKAIEAELAKITP